MKILFIGNSHTYVNNMPGIVKELITNAGLYCHVTMLAHPGWRLKDHLENPELEFNIIHGDYDYIVCQEYAHPFGPVEELFDSLRKIKELVDETYSQMVLFPTWAPKYNLAEQERMSKSHQQIAEELEIPLAPVDMRWMEVIQKHKNVELYSDDGEHASIEGTKEIARTITQTILGLEMKKLKEEEIEPEIEKKEIKRINDDPNKTTQRYIKIRADFAYLEKGRFYRIFLIREDASLEFLGQFMVEIFGGAMEHYFLFHTKEHDYIPAMWLDEFANENDLSYEDYDLIDLPDTFKFNYDTGDGWDFNCKIYKTLVEKDLEDEFIPSGFVLEGAGMGIWEDNIGSLYAYASGEIDPDFAGEDEELGIYKPWNFTIEKYSEFDDPIDIEYLDEIAQEFEMQDEEDEEYF